MAVNENIFYSVLFCNQRTTKENLRDQSELLIIPSEYVFGQDCNQNSEVRLFDHHSFKSLIFSLLS